MEEDFKHMVRIARKDVDGNKPVVNALRGCYSGSTEA